MIDVCRIVGAPIDGRLHPSSVGVPWSPVRASESAWSVDLPRGIVTLICTSLGTLLCVRFRIHVTRPPRLATWPFVLAAIGVGLLLIGSNPLSGAILMAAAFVWSIGLVDRTP
jgi:hypothetical protein